MHLLTPILTELSKAEAECEQLIREVEEYAWDTDPYPRGFLPYPEQDIDFFHSRARDAKHLKVRILALLDRLGAAGQQCRDQITAIDFYEVYLGIDDPLAYGAKRPVSSGLAAACGVLKAVRASITGSAEGELKPHSAVKAKPGPKRKDHEKIAAVVRQFDPQWRSRVNEITLELDRLHISIPKQWRRKKYATWDDASVDKALVIKSLENSLKQAHKS